MNAIDFVNAISIIASNYVSANNDFAKIIIDDLTICKKNTNVNVPSNNALIDLIFNYDISKLRILTISFNQEEEIKEDEKYIYVGWAEAFPFAISKETGEIVELDWEDPNYIISYMAKNQNSFLDVLCEIEKLNQRELLENITHKDRKEIIDKIQEIAGGTKYSWFRYLFE